MGLFLAVFNSQLSEVIKLLEDNESPNSQKVDDLAEQKRI